VIRGNDQGTRFELEGDIVRLGRDATNAIQLHDSEVSRQHAELRRGEQGYVISDLNSSNGTFVNGQRIRQHALATGDQVQVGATLLLYTGSSGESEDQLAQAIDITAAPLPGDKSRIISALAQAEGGKLFAPETELPTHSWLARARSNLQVMYRTALAVSHTLEIDALLQRILELIFEWVEADRGCIMLFDPESKQLQPKARRTRRGGDQREKIIISKTILDYVLERNEGVLTSDAQQDARWEGAASILQAAVREAICVPMQGRYDLVGVIYIDTTIPPEEFIRRGQVNKFTEDHLKLMIAIGHQAALAVEDTRYYSALVQAERLAAVGQTVATLSHHIKNILQGIRGGSYLIELGLNEHDEEIIRKGWKIVEKNQHKISSLVLDMLTFSKDREPHLETANLNQTVADVVELMQAHASESGVTIHWLPAPHMPEMVFDPEGLHRAVLNVLTNAIDAASEQEQPGRVAIRTECLPDLGVARVYVEDNGPGIPLELQEKIFTPFVSTKKGRGTGLGLAVTQKILKEHGGRVLLESAPGKGSLFILELPAVPPRPGIASSAADLPATVELPPWPHNR
jgi:signal transduction histidine kinase/pSer/pThr/pTyr-binding forkhead associated (FHA) protein